MALSKIGGNQIDTVSGDLTVDTNTLKVDSSNNRVGVGLTAPEQPFHVRSSTFAYMRSESTNATYTGLDVGQHQSGYGVINMRDNQDIRFYTNDAEKLRIQAAGGISFNGDTATPNALDDYEEGDWTPDIRQNGTAVSDAAYNTSFNGGQYTKVGRVVHATGTLRITSKGTVTGTNTFQVGGLPFTSTNNVKARSPVNLFNHLGAGIDMSGNTNGTLMGFLTHNSDEISFRVEDFSGTTGEVVQFNDIGNTLYLQLSIFYITG